jgi:thymidylate kinase
MRLIILEGGRGTGKSTIARAIREKVSEITLINPTGFHDDGAEGHEKIAEYYWNWYEFLKTMKYHDSTFVFDRFFFSERVFSELYKDYDFSNDYRHLVFNLKRMAMQVDVIFFTIEDEEELKGRLLRDKVPFGKAEESVAETIKQQNLYKTIMQDFTIKHTYDNVKFHHVDTTRKTLSEIEKEIIEIVGGQ